jgi:putative transposase
LVDHARQEHGLSIRSACSAIRVSRSVYYYKPDVSKDDAVIAEVQAITERYPAYGFSKVFTKVKRAGHPWNHKRVYRVYCALNLNLRRKGKKRLPSRNPEPLAVPADMNQCWSIDFMSDSLFCGIRFRTFNVVDDYNREALAIEVDLSLPSVRVVRVLERIVAWRGYPAKIRMGNGPEFISVMLADWAEKHDIQLEFIKPGKPTQNSYVERFNRTYRTEVLNMYAFKRLSEVREITDNGSRSTTKNGLMTHSVT